MFRAAENYMADLTKENQDLKNEKKNMLATITELNETLSNLKNEMEILQKNSKSCIRCGHGVEAILTCSECYQIVQ